MRYCALICEPSELRANGANGECGTGSCQSVAGVGLCTYAQQEATNSAVVTLLRSNPTHYGDPKTGCESDEQAVQVQGVSGGFCSPACSSAGSCPSDKPAGDSAAPQCALQSPTGDKSARAGESRREGGQSSFTHRQACRTLCTGSVI